MNTAHVQRPEPLLLCIDRLGKWYAVQPPTRGQVREALALDKPDAEAREGLVVIDERISRQLTILLGSACEVKPDETHEGDVVGYTAVAGAPALSPDLLTGDEEREMLTAIICWHNGMDPASAVATQRALKKNAMEHVELASASSTPTPTGSPANSASPSAPQSGSDTPKA